MPRPFIGVSFGLLEHRKRMGQSWWLYFYLHTKANFRDPSGEVKWVVEEAAKVLDVTGRTIRLWYQHLKDEDYLESVGDDWVQEKTTIITKYKSVPLMAAEQRVEKDFQGVERTFHPGRKDLSTPSYIYKELTFRTLKGFFEAMLDAINQASNPIAELRYAWSLIWGDKDTPDFGRLGAAAKRAGNGQPRPGARVLAMRSVVASVGRRVVGNPIDYVSKMGGDGNGRRADHPLRGDGRSGSAPGPGESDWTDPDRHGDWGKFVTTPHDEGDPVP